MLMARMRATLDALPRATSTSGSSSARSTRATPSARERALRRARRAGPRLPSRRRAVAAHHALRRRQGPRARAVDRRADLLRVRRRLPPDKRERGFDRLVNVLGADHHGYVGRMRAALGAARRRSGPARAPAPAVRPPRRGRRARVDVQAPRRLRHARRADRRDRRRRDALVPARALARHDDRARPRARDASSRREPRLLRPVRARADRLDAAQGGGGAGGRRAGRAARRGSRSSRPSAR